MAEETVILTLTGPSGAGKSELAGALAELYPDHVSRWRQFTTRPRRGPGEAYVFLSPAQFAAVEGAMTARTGFGGHRYGTVPEAGCGGRAVVVVADREGHADLAAHARAHNAALARGEEPSPRLAEGPVRLVSALLTYEPDEASVAARGRASRGLAFVLGELEGLRDFPADVRVDTTREWPDPEAFFMEHVWPAMQERADWGAAAREELDRAADLAAASEGAARSLAAALAAWRGGLAAGAAPPGEADELLAALGAGDGPAAAPPGGPQGGAEGGPQGGEPPPAQPPGEPPAPAAASPAAGAPAAEPWPAGSLAELVEAAPRKGKNPPRHRSITSLMREFSFEDWMLGAKLGANAYTNGGYFEGVFKRFMMEKGAVFPGVLTFSGERRGAGATRSFRARHELEGRAEEFRVEFDDALGRPTLFRTLPVA